METKTLEIEVTPLGEELQAEGEAVVRVIRKAEIDEDSVVLIALGQRVPECCREKFAKFLKENLPSLKGRGVLVGDMPEFAVVRVKEKPQATPVEPAIPGRGWPDGVRTMDFLASPVAVDEPHEDPAKGIGKGWPDGVPFP